MEKLEIESHRNFAIARGENGEAIIQPDIDGEWRYVYENGTLDAKSQVDRRNPTIKLEANSFIADSLKAQKNGEVATRNATK